MTGTQRLLDLAADIAAAGPVTRRKTAAQIRGQIAATEDLLDRLHDQLAAAEQDNPAPGVGRPGYREWVVTGVTDGLTLHRDPTVIAREHGYRCTDNLSRSLTRWGRADLAGRIGSRKNTT